MKQRLLSICMALCLCLTLLPTAAWASGGDAAPDTGGTGDGGSQETVTVGNWDDLLREIGGKDKVDIALRGDI